MGNQAFHASLPKNDNALRIFTWLAVAILPGVLIPALGEWCSFRLAACRAMQQFVLGIVVAFDDRRPGGANNAQGECIFSPRYCPLEIARPYYSRGKRGKLKVTTRIARIPPS